MLRIQPHSSISGDYIHARYSKPDHVFLDQQATERAVTMQGALKKSASKNAITRLYQTAKRLWRGSVLKIH